MIEKKLSFVSLSNAYVEYLEQIKEDNENKLIEAETCVMESFIYNRKDKDAASHNSALRALYLLNKSNRFNVQAENKKYNYNEEEARKLSWYERNKNSNS